MANEDATGELRGLIINVDGLGVLVIAQPGADMAAIQAQAQKSAANHKALKTGQQYLQMVTPGEMDAYIDPAYRLCDVVRVQDKGRVVTVHKLSKAAERRKQLEAEGQASKPGRGRPSGAKNGVKGTITKVDGGVRKGKKAAGSKKSAGDDVTLAQLSKQKKTPLVPLVMNEEAIDQLAYDVRNYVLEAENTARPVTSWSNFTARFPRDYVMLQKERGNKVTGHSILAILKDYVENRYENTWGWKGGWPPAAEALGSCVLNKTT